MKCQGKFKYRGLERKEAGSYIGKDGIKRDYKAKYHLKLDETTEDGIVERVFKVELDSPFVPKILSIKPYEDFIIQFNINIYKNGSVSLIPEDIITSTK